ncbi:MAG: hypothetical protein ISR51_06585 [Rhodospirillales bacterium]|nr:hypothetical protein [Alphaproteobacteria bacterium]MBL6948326.1 hypothetical protein [Rhodospirillales bacterium]
MASWFVPALIGALFVAIFVVRRKMKDSESPFGLWCVKHLKPLMAKATTAFFILTLAAWILIFLVTPKEERGGFQDVVRDFQKAIGLKTEEAGDQTPSGKPSFPPPFRIPGPGETAKPIPAPKTP